MKKTLISLFTIAFSASLWAVTATPNPFAITQPDGSTIMVKLIGDEYHAYYTTVDGTPLRQLENGFFVEDLSVQEQFAPVAQKRRASAVRPKQEASTFPLAGSPKSVVILVGFKDLPFAQTLESFDELLNKSGYDHNGATGSCRDYFIAASDSLFQPQFDVYGPYTLEGKMEDYGAATNSDHDKNPGQMIIDACQAAEAAGVDFAQYDINNDGVLDNVFVYYAGHNQAEGGGANTVWPHKSDLSWKNVKVGGKVIATYACTSEYSGSAGKVRASIGTFCHEFGHVLGLPDLYDTNYKYYTVSNWDIMCSGNYNNNGRTPPTYSAYERFFLGWLAPQQLAEKGEYILEPIQESNQAYLIADGQHNLSGSNPNPREFFVLECRTKTGWDAYLPGSGMLVWHIDYLATAWYTNTPNNGPDILRIHMEEANGIPWNQRGINESGRASDPYPGTQKVTQYIPKLHDGTLLSDQNIFDIEDHDTWISFIYKSVGDIKVQTDVQEITLTTTVSDDKKIVDWNPQAFVMTAENLSDSIITLTTKSGFYLAAADEAPIRSSKDWKRTLTIAVQDTSIVQKVWVSYIPTKQSCDEVNATIGISTAGASASIGIKAYSPRPVYITTPELKPVTNITPFSFRIAWNPVKDAVVYYLTLFQVQDGEASFVQGFENFNDYTKIKEEGWESTTNLTTTSAKSEGTKSLYLKKTGDQITSELYQAPVTNVSFWINAFTSNVSEIGYIDLEAWNGEKWIVSDSWKTTILSSTKRKVFEYSFAAEDNYTQFRLTYTDNGGSGAAIDAFTATCSRKITYLYKGKDLVVDAIYDEAYCTYDFRELQSNATYYYYMQSSDITKGCEENISQPNEPVAVTTAQVSDNNGKDENILPIAIDVNNYDKPTPVVYLSDARTGDLLNIYDVKGALVYSCLVVDEGKVEYEIPIDKLQKNCLYLIKHITNGKMKRKQSWAKFMY